MGSERICFRGKGMLLRFNVANLVYKTDHGYRKEVSRHKSKQRKQIFHNETSEIKNNLEHPTYKALQELGKAVKTVFLSSAVFPDGKRKSPSFAGRAENFIKAKIKALS